MMQLNEWLSVNDEVTNIANGITDEITKLTSNCEKQIGKIGSVPYTSGRFVFKDNGAIGDIIVDYLMYFCKDEVDYTILNNHSAFNCGADSDENRIVINCYSIGNEIDEDLLSAIAHEVNHLYQYANGFNKNVNLYDNVVAALNDEYIDEVGWTIAYLIYFTFRHEVDSFATQFYHVLHSYDEYVSFEYARNNFKLWLDVDKLRQHYSVFTNQQISHAAKRFGLKGKQCRIRIKTGLKRMENKLFNVYRRYSVEKLRHNTVESKIKRHEYLCAKYGMLPWETLEPVCLITEDKDYNR